ncbi:MAG: hypothetical protein GY757_60475 [bacterium]|nr:hypothetical protein [bacterium]
MKKIALLLSLIMFTSFIFAKKVATLTEISRPDTFLVAKDGIYIVEGTDIYIFSISDYKLKVKFGKKGEGPEEFRVRPGGGVSIFPLDEYIYTRTLGKVSKFTKKGEFVKEIKTKFGNYFSPLGHSKFVGSEEIVEDKKPVRTINIYDSNVKRVVAIGKVPDLHAPGVVDPFVSPLAFMGCGKHVFLALQTDFTIEMLDFSGKKIKTIKREPEKLKVPAQYRKDLLNWFKKEARVTERYYIYLKKALRVPEYFPAIAGMQVMDNKLYVKTYKVEDEKHEFYIYDCEGNYLETKMIKLIKRNPILPYPFAVSNGMLYELVENLDEEEWDLYVRKL